MAASKILLLLAVGLLIGGAVASFGAFKEFRRTSSQGQGGGRTEWALPVVILDFVAAVLIIISQLPNGEGAAGRGAADCMIKVFHRNAFSDEPISSRS